MINQQKTVEGNKLNTVVDLVLSRIGKNSYTQTSARENVFGEPTGNSDCSSLMWKCYERGAGIYIGGNTDAQIKYGRRIWTNPTGSRVFTKELQAQSGAERGDLIFWGSTGSDMAHVEMFLGNNQCIGHGSGWGPTIKTLSSYNHTYTLRYVHRYIEGGGTDFVSLVNWIPG